jgi:hypothetical protein
MAIKTGFIIFSTLFFYSLSCLSFGLLLYNILVGRKNGKLSGTVKNNAVVLATAFLLGQGILANLWILLGLKGWFFSFIVKGIVTVAALSGILFLPSYLNGFWIQLKNIYRETRSDSWAWQFIAILGILFCVAGVSALGAPLLEDSANFYMTQPKVMAETYRYQLIPSKSPYYSGGYQGEMNHAVLMSLGSTDAARLYSWITLLAGIVLLLGLCTQAGIGRRGKWIALALAMTSSMAYMLLGKGKVDLFQMAMGLGVYYWMTHESHHARRISSLLAGFAVLGKMVYAVTLLPGMLILLVWQQLQKQPCGIKLPSLLSSYIKDSLELALWGGISIFPIFIYNYVLFNNPLVVGDLLSGFTGWGVAAPYVPPHVYVTAPLFLTFGRLPYGQLGNISVLVLMFLPMVLWMPFPRSWRNSILTWLTASAFAGIMVIFLLFPTAITYPRFYMACLLLFIPIVASAAEYITLTESHPRLLTFSIQASLIIVLLSTFIENTQEGYFDSFFFKKSVLYLQGDIPECGLEGGGWLGQRCRGLSVINQQAQLGDRVLSNITHNYYLRSDLLLCGNNNEMVTDYVAQSGEQETEWNKIYLNGYRFLAIDKFYFPLPNVDNPPDWIKVSKIFEEWDIVVYHLDYIHPLEKPLLMCGKSQNGMWNVMDFSE